jgi:hypothetical protein
MTSMASITRPKRDVPGLRDANLHRLERLAAELRRCGIAADLVLAPGRIPRLEVVHPAGPAEDVYAWRGQDGMWWFWWSWAERIARAADPGDAAARIEQVLNRQSWG